MQLEMLWNGHDWEGPGSQIWNQVRRDYDGWFRLKKPVCLSKLPKGVQVELPSPLSCVNGYIPSSCPFRLLGLKPGHTLSGEIP